MLLSLHIALILHAGCQMQNYILFVRYKNSYCYDSVVSECQMSELCFIHVHLETASNQQLKKCIFAFVVCELK